MGLADTNKSKSVDRVVSIGAVIYFGMVAMLIYFQVDTYVSRRSILDNSEVVDLQHDLRVLATRANIVEKDVGNMKHQLNSVLSDVAAVKAGGGDLSLIGLKTQISTTQTQLGDLVKAFGSDVERNLSVPLLRKDMAQLEQTMRDRTAIAISSVDRIYTQNNWFLGTFTTVFLAMLGISGFNWLQRRTRQKANEG